MDFRFIKIICSFFLEALLNPEKYRRRMYTIFNVITVQTYMFYNNASQSTISKEEKETFLKIQKKKKLTNKHSR